MEEFSFECINVSEIDWEYEFDAACFYDFCCPESPSEAKESERWFETCGNYPPSPIIVKLNLWKDNTTEYSRGPSRLQEEKTTQSSSNNSYIHISSANSPSKPNAKGTLSKGQMAYESPKAKTNSESLRGRGSTFMKPTASYLAKLRSLKPPSQIDERSSWNSSGSYNAATKRQKLESGYLRKVTVPREPQLETMQRAQRRRCRLEGLSCTAETSKARPLNIKILRAPALPPHPKATSRSTVMYPPVELFNKLSLRSERETSVVSQPKIHAS